MANNKSILFVSNYTLTELYLRLALELEKEGYTAYWLCAAREWEAKLLEHFPVERVTKLDRALRDQPVTDVVPTIPLNEIRYIDREVSTWAPHKAEAYMLNAHAKIKNLLVEHDICAAFSENTWAHEIMVAMLCQFDPAVRARHFSPHPLRIPDQRIAFFSNFLLNEMMPAGRDSGKLEVEDLFAKRGDIARQDAAIVARKKRTPFRSLVRLAKFVFWRTADRTDPTWHGTSRLSGIRRALRRFACEVGYGLTKKLSQEDFVELAKRRDVYIYAFHKVPETAINNKGRYYEDQAARIIDLWRKLPAGAALVIKEHRVSVGDRGWRYFRRLLQFSDVVLLDHRADPAVLREHAKACFTISGTMAYEFALNGKPGVTFAPTYFNALQHSFNLTTGHFLDGRTLDQIMTDNTRVGLDLPTFATHLAAHSHDGEVNEPQVEPRVLSEENIAMLAEAALATLTQLNSASGSESTNHG
ncbi:MAG: hypothetical protein CMN71_03355 [Sphingomonadaceae bacterium]|nr:hypothetical protein [Sphingomonadaceae bacterium]